MMLRSGFFNSVNGDRTYNASRFAEYFASFISSGVFPNPSTNLQAMANSDMTITVKAGKAWINGYILINDGDYILSIAPADGVLNRIDRVVARFDVLGREITVEVKQGAFGSVPVAPALQRDADAYELGLADIHIGNGVVAINQGNITDLRLDSELCGIVHGVVDQVDLTTLFNQYTDGFELKKEEFEQAFNDWFQSLQDVLDENTATNLLNMINVNTESIDVVDQKVDGHLADDVNHVKYAVDTGTANAKIVTFAPAPTEYVDGMALTFKNAVQNTGAVTINVNGLGAKSILKSNGNALSSGNLKVGIPYTLRYNGTAFILQGEGGEYGTAEAPQVLSGYTVGRENGVVAGTMPNRTGDVTGQSVSRSGTSVRIRPQEGYYSGLSSNSVQISDANFVANNIKQGVSIFGLVGTIAEGEVLAGYDYAHTDNAERVYSPPPTGPTKMYEFLTQVGGTLRLYYDVSCDGGTGGRLQIYVNGSPVGIQRNDFVFYTSYQEDIPVKVGDKIQIYVWRVAPATVRVKNVSVRLSLTSTVSKIL